MLRVLSTALLALAFAPALPAYADTTVAPQIQLNAVSKLTYDNQSTTVTGTVTYTASDGTTQPLANQAVQVSCYMACTDFTATTDANGQFTVPVTPQWWELSVTATIAASSTVAAASNTLWLNALTQTRITATATPDVITSATQVATISGVLQYQGDDGTWKPLPGRTVRISASGANTTVTTASDGSFTQTLTLTRSASSLSQWISVQWSPWTDDNTLVDETFFYDANTSVSIANPATVAFTSFQATANADGTITASGALTITPSTPTVIQFEYSADGTSGWQPLGTPADATTAASGTFSSTFQAPLPTGWYRAVVAPGPDTLGAMRTAVQTGRTVTRVTGFKVSATKVKVGKTFKITGTLQQDVNAAWKPLAGQQVWILLKPKGSTTWFWYSKPRTSASGAFSATIKVIKGMTSAWWIPVYYGATGYYDSSPANPIYVTVH